MLTHTFTGITPNPGFQDDPTLYGAINSSRSNEISQTTDRTIDTFAVNAGFIPPPIVPVTILSASIGNADFQATATNTLNQTYSQTPNWYNAQGISSDEELNFTFNSQMNGSTDPAHTDPSNYRGAMVFHQRTSVNDTGYTIASAGEVFTVQYVLGAGGNEFNWDGDETNTVFLFTANAPVDGAIVNLNMTRIVEWSRFIDRATEGQWSIGQNINTNFYTTAAADVGETVYFGVEFDQGAGLNLFPRIDDIRLAVIPVPPAAGPVLSIARNGANMDVSFDSENGSNYQLQTNSDITSTNWTDQGSAVTGDGTTRTEPVPISGTELYIRTEIR